LLPPPPSFTSTFSNRRPGQYSSGNSTVVTDRSHSVCQQRTAKVLSYGGLHRSAARICRQFPHSGNGISGLKVLFIAHVTQGYAVLFGNTVHKNKADKYRVAFVRLMSPANGLLTFYENILLVSKYVYRIICRHR